MQCSSLKMLITCKNNSTFLHIVFSKDLKCMSVDFFRNDSVHDNNLSHFYLKKADNFLICSRQFPKIVSI